MFTINLRTFAWIRTITLLQISMFVKSGIQLQILKIIRILNYLPCQYSFGGWPCIVLARKVRPLYSQDLLWTININCNALMKDILSCFHQCMGLQNQPRLVETSELHSHTLCTRFQSFVRSPLCTRFQSFVRSPLCDVQGKLT